MNWLPKKQEPLYFNPPPPNLARNIAEAKSKKKGTSDSKGNATTKYRFHFESFASFLEGTDGEDLQAVVDDLVSLARSEKLYIKPITKDELEAVSTAAQYMLGKDDYKAAEGG
jgi:DNA-directed RNA polymerase subunit F